MFSLVQGWPYSTEKSGNTVSFERDVRSSNDVAHLKCQSKEIFVLEQNKQRERSQITEINFNIFGKKSLWRWSSFHVNVNKQNCRYW